MKAAIYVRVSTSEQVSEGHSLDAQLERCKAYCVSQGWEIVELYVEEGESAKNLNRTKLKELLSAAEDGLFDVLLVYRLDRLTRSVSDLYTLLERLEKSNVKFKSATELYDTTTAMGKLFITLVAALAEWELNNLRERVRFGMEELVKQGKWHGGPIPFGYDWDGETMHIVPEEAVILKELRRLYMSGLGFRGVALELNGRGLLRRDGAPWTHEAVHYCLENPFYAGKMIYGSRNKGGIYVKHKKDDRVKVIWSDTDYPTIFTWEEYEEQTKRMKKRQSYGTGKRRQYWFVGAIRCGRCGSPLVGRSSNGKEGKLDTYKHYNYICAGRKNGKGCNLPLLKQELAERMIIDYVRAVNHSMEEVAAAREKLSLQVVDHNSEKDHLQKELRTVAERRKKWQYMFAEDMISEVDFRSRKREEDEKEKILKEQLDNIKASEAGVNSDNMSFLIDLPELWYDFDDADKKEMVQTIFESIVFDCDVETGKGVGRIGKSLPFRITEVNYN